MANLLTDLVSQIFWDFWIKTIWYKYPIHYILNYKLTNNSKCLKKVYIKKVRKENRKKRAKCNKSGKDKG